jgi:two-component system, NtrC family, response regulator AlgB
MPRSHTKQPASSDPPSLLQSTNAQMARAIATAEQVAMSDVPVVLMGESGTGKKLLATAIHRWSLRHAGPFATLCCAALAAHPIESTLLGHLDGALIDARKGKSPRFDAVKGGTLFLDEIGNGNLPVAFQVRLLRFLEEQRARTGSQPVELDARIIAATIHDLEADVRSGRLRHDLFFSLSVVAIALPPLRERGEDLQHLTDHFLARLAARHRRGALRLAPETARLFARYQWPGNVRELLSVLERAVVVSRGATITPEELPTSLTATRLSDDLAIPTQALSLHEIEQRHIARILGESVTYGEAAARLGIDPTTLWRKRKRYRLVGRRLSD